MGFCRQRLSPADVRHMPLRVGGEPVRPDLSQAVRMVLCTGRGNGLVEAAMNSMEGPETHPAPIFVLGIMQRRGPGNSWSSSVTGSGPAPAIGSSGPPGTWRRMRDGG